MRSLPYLAAATLAAICLTLPGQARAEASALAHLHIEQQGARQSPAPFTIGQVFASGLVQKNIALQARLPDGSVVALQTDIKAQHPDGSVRHAIVSGILPASSAKGRAMLTLQAAPAMARPSSTPPPQLPASLDGSISIVEDGVRYEAQLASALKTNTISTWLSGPVVTEWRASVPLKNAKGVAHPLLSATFALRWYHQLAHQGRLEVVLENTKTFAPNRNLRYDVTIDVGGRQVFSQNNLVHYRHARWRHLAWWDPAQAPQLHLRPALDELTASRAIPNYDPRIVPHEAALGKLAASLGPDKTGPMTIGPVKAYMPTTGGRDDIGPLPAWSVMYLLSGDARARAAMLAAAEGSASWSVHLRDERTGLPLRVDTPANRDISTHSNYAHRGPLPVPRCTAGDVRELCGSPYTHDTAHQPSLVYLPYLLTGDYYYLEELQFWAATNPLATAPENSGKGQGLVRWQQVRAQAWSLRTLGHAAWITPDAHPLKRYFERQLDNNLAFYQATYVTGNPNRLGAYDGSGAHAFRNKDSAPWQDDFLTWSFGHLAELGFTKALPILRWKAAYPIGRMTDPGYCWIDAAAYSLKLRVRDDERAPVLYSFEQLYQANFGGDVYINDDRKRVTHPAGTRYIDQACASQAQADWLSALYRRNWPPGRMTGYADSPIGYPANLQPALALAASFKLAKAEQAWARFDSRAAQPDYSKAPQWAIIPRR